MRKVTTLSLALIVLLGAAVWYGYSLNSKVEQHATEVQTLDPVIQKQVETTAKKVADKVDKNGIKHTVYEMVKEIDQSAVNAIRSDLLDTVAELNILRQRLRQVMVINTQLAIQNQKLTKSTDSRNTLYSFKDKYLDAIVRIPFDSSQQATLDLTHETDLIPVQYNKRRFLRTPQPMIDVYSTDKRVTIGGVRSLTIKPNPPVMGLSIDLASEYDFRSKTLRGGPAISLDLKRFNLEGKYLLDRHSNEWTWVLNGNYKLLKL